MRGRCEERRGIEEEKRRRYSFREMKVGKTTKKNIY